MMQLEVFRGELPLLVVGCPRAEGRQASVERQAVMRGVACMLREVVCTRAGGRVQDGAERQVVMRVVHAC